jgi:uncharacterized repeat protein (TIGR01451 family)
MDVRVLAVMAATLLTLSINASAAINDWTAMGPSGGAVNKIVYSQNGNTAYMAAAGGYYRSQDSGVSWQLVKSDFLNAPVDVSIDPSDPTRVYVVTQNAPCLYVSTDGGATLAANTALPSAVTQAHQIAVSKDGTTLYLSNDGRIFYSPDRGQTWLERAAISGDATTSVLKLLIDPTDPKTLYAAVATASTVSEGIFATHDGAQTWQQLTSGAEGASLTQDLAINPTNSAQIWSAQYDGIWVSADRGVHWSNVFSTTMSAIAIDPTNPAILYAGTPYGKVYRSVNAGVSWGDVSGNILAGENLHLTVNPAAPTQLLAGGIAGVSGSSTSGTTWFSQQMGFNATRVTSFSADPTADRIYVHLRSNGVFYTASGATTILPVNNDALLHLSTLPTIDVTAILAQQGRLFASLNNGLTFSTDGGITWAPEVEVLPPTGSEQIFNMTSTAAAPQSILASSSGPVAKSSDGGATWREVTGFPANGSVPAGTSATGLLFAPSNPSIAYAAVYSNGAGALGLYKSTDTGNNWAAVNQNPVSSALNLLAVDPSNASIVYGSGAPLSETLLKSVDGAVTWSTLTWDISSSANTPNVLTIDPVHPNILYAASNERIGRSVDGGASWETLRGSSPPLWIPSALIADPKRPENLLVGTDGTGVQQITIAPDLTLAVTSPTSPLAVGASATYTYTATNQGPFDATGVKVTVQLPSTAQSVTASASGGSCAVSGTAASCIFPIMRKGANGSLTVTAVAPSAGAFPVSAAVVGDQPDSDPTDNAVSSSATVTTISDMSVTATGNAAAHVGDAVSYTLVATNVGPNVAPAAQLSFQLAAGLTLGTVSSADATCTGGASGQVTCNLNDLAVAKAVTVTVNATAATQGTQTSTAAVISGATDLVSANNTASATTTVSAVPPPANSGGGGGGGDLSLYEVLALAMIFLGSLLKNRGRSLRADEDDAAIQVVVVPDL